MRARLRGTEIYFDIDGAALVPDGGRMTERPVLFLLHGGPGGDHSSFKTTVGPLRDVAQLVYLDHRGSGRSAADDPASWTLENNIEDIEALRQHLGLDRICVLGQSYGGVVAQGYAIRYGQHLRGLILGVTAPSYRFFADAQKIVAERGTPEQQRVCQWLWDANFTSEEQLREFYRAMGPMYSVKFDPAAFEETWGRGIRNFVQLNMGFGGFMREFDYLDKLPTIACPTLVLGGAHDWICPPDHSRQIAERIPRAHLKIFAHSAHSIAADEPEAYCAALRGFLTYLSS